MSDGALEWWANRKSRIGVTTKAKQPPHLPGNKPWWTTPPIAPPEPEYMEYALRYQVELVAITLDSKADYNEKRRANVLLMYLAQWIKAARRLYNHRVMERRASDGDTLTTTEGLIQAARRCINRLMAEVTRSGGVISERDRAVLEAIRQRDDETAHRNALRMQRGRQ